jgi:hypothetical protein
VSPIIADDDILRGHDQRSGVNLPALSTTTGLIRNPGKRRGVTRNGS